MVTAASHSQSEQSQHASELLELCRKHSHKIVTAESCTGGLVAAALTNVPGSSSVVTGGFVTYSNEMKQDILHVPLALLQTYGAVSEQVAKAMVEGALQKSKQATLAVSVTGIAGPGGGSAEKSVGLIYIGFMRRGQHPQVKRLQLSGSREDIRLQTVTHAIKILKSLV